MTTIETLASQDTRLSLIRTIGEAFSMVEALAGNANSFECFHGLRRDSPWGRKSSRHVHGAITDHTIASKLDDWSLNGFESRFGRARSTTGY